MAERRMISKKIVDTDFFLNQSVSAQNLYFHLLVRADDDGFISNPKTIMRIIGASQEDMLSLIRNKFVIDFESGVVVIKHWKIHNYIKSDRYKETTWKDEKQLLSTDENGSYTLKCIQNGSKMDTQVSIGKNSIDKNNIVTKKENNSNLAIPTLTEVEEYCKSRNSSVDPKTFYDYFETGNWKDSKGNKVKNWKQKIITWEKHNTPTNQKPNIIPTYETDTETDFDEDEFNRIMKER